MQHYSEEPAYRSYPQQKQDFKGQIHHPAVAQTVEFSHWPLTKCRGKYRARVLKAITIHSCWHRSKDKLHRCFSCCVILISGRTSVGWQLTTFLGSTLQDKRGDLAPWRAWGWGVAHLADPALWWWFSPQQHVKCCLHTRNLQAELFLQLCTSPAVKLTARHWEVRICQSAQCHRFPLYLGQEMPADDYTVVMATTIN